MDSLTYQAYLGSKDYDSVIQMWKKAIEAKEEALAKEPKNSQLRYALVLAQFGMPTHPRIAHMLLEASASSDVTSFNRKKKVTARARDRYCRKFGIAQKSGAKFNLKIRHAISFDRFRKIPLAFEHLVKSKLQKSAH